MVGATKMTITQYLDELVWSKAELIRRTRLSARTVDRVLDGEPVYRHTVAAIAKAFTEALGKKVTVDDIEGVNIIQ